MSVTVAVEIFKEFIEITSYDKNKLFKNKETKEEYGSSLDKIILDLKKKFNDRLTGIYVVENELPLNVTNFENDSLVHFITQKDLDFTHYLLAKLEPKIKILEIGCKEDLTFKCVLYEFVSCNNNISEYKPIKCLEFHTDVENYYEMMIQILECNPNEIYLLVPGLFIEAPCFYLQELVEKQKQFYFFALEGRIYEQKAFAFGLFMSSDEDIQSLAKLNECSFLTNVRVMNFDFELKQQIISHCLINAYKSQTKLMGIDLGASRNVVAVSRNESVELVRIDQDYAMPSVFSFAEEHPVVGSVGMRHLKTKNKSKAVLYDLKHLMGTKRRLNDGTWPFAICTAPEKMSFVVNSDGKFEEFTTIEIYQILLQKLKAAASAYQSDLNDKNPVNQAVITIPDFEDKLIIADVCQAAEIANVEIIDIITEIHSDLLYLLSKYNVRPDEEVIIVDIGGGTGYIQKFSMIQGLKEKHVLSFLSGRRINEMLWKQLELTLLSKYQMRIDDRFILMTEMERIKETLSFDESANIQLPVIWARFKKDIEPVTKIWFEENVMARVFNDKENKKILENAMDDMNNPSKPSKVFLVGGTCWIPYIQNYFKSVFGEDKVVVPNNLQNITATGALIHGLQILNGFVEPTFVKIKI